MLYIHPKNKSWSNTGKAIVGAFGVIWMGFHVLFIGNVVFEKILALFIDHVSREVGCGGEQLLKVTPKTQASCLHIQNCGG